MHGTRTGLRHHWGQTYNGRNRGSTEGGCNMERCHAVHQQPHLQERKAKGHWIKQQWLPLGCHMVAALLPAPYTQVLTSSASRDPLDPIGGPN